MMPFGFEARMADALVVKGQDFRVHAAFAHAAGDHLGVLGTEIENNNLILGRGNGEMTWEKVGLVVVGANESVVGLFGIMRPCPCSPR